MTRFLGTGGSRGIAIGADKRLVALLKSYMLTG